MSEISKLLSQTLEVPVENIFTIKNDSDNIYGKFLVAGKIFDYRIDDDSQAIFYSLNKLDSAYVNGYCRAIIDAIGLNYHGDAAYDYLMGARFDADKCKTGTPCGGTCLPKGHKCKLGDRVRHAMLNAREELSNSASWGSEQQSKLINQKIKQSVSSSRYGTAPTGERSVAESFSAGIMHGLAENSKRKHLQKQLEKEEGYRAKQAQKRANIQAKRQRLIEKSVPKT